MSVAIIKKYKPIFNRVKAIIANESKCRDNKLEAICQLLSDEIATFDWVGFYLVDPEAKRELVLGPFVGEPTEHKRISFGEGICGQAAETNQTFVVQDVSKADNYLSCSLHVQAEIVVPVKKNGKFVAELDIDSHTKGSITSEDQALLENICDEAAKLF